MNYIKELNAFDTWVSENSDLHSSARLLWFIMMQHNNSVGWKTELSIPISTLCSRSGLSKQAVIRARNSLKQFGLIDFTSRGGNKAAVYRMISISNSNGNTHNDTQNNTHNDTQNNTHDDTHDDTLSKHKLNINIKKESIKKERQKRETFNKPSLEEVKAYCLERKSCVDWQRWYDFYESKGWFVGKNKMKDWKACVRTWERNSKKDKLTNEWKDVVPF